MALRFANARFEPVWNGHRVDYVPITATENLGIEARAGDYEQAGALRDPRPQPRAVQLPRAAGDGAIDHIQGQSVRNETVKVLDAIVPPAVEESPR
jgi:glucose-6-phosphate 1-dehydrogenase